MRVFPRDPLLGAARLLLGLMTVLAGAFAVVLAFAIAATMVFPQAMLGWLARHGFDGPPDQAVSMLTGAMAGMIAISVCGVIGMRLLRRLIDTVGEGDPFVPENARRLSAMAWLTAAVQVLLIPVDGMLTWLTIHFGHIRTESGFSLGGILLTLLLFILARVFRQGAAMREELEGTV
jgi:Protein of unknown function (DUF2975)